MNSIAKCNLLQNLKTLRRYCVHTPVLSRNHQYRSNGNHEDQGSKRFDPKISIFCFCVALTGGYLNKDRLFPTVTAASPFNLQGRRKQFNFIADVVQVSAPSLVYIEIKGNNLNTSIYQIVYK